MPARRRPPAARRRPRAAGARRPLHGASQPVVAGRLDHRAGRRRLHAPARAARALADRGRASNLVAAGWALAARAAAPAGASGARRRRGPPSPTPGVRLPAAAGYTCGRSRCSDRRPAQYRCRACPASSGRARATADAASRRPRPKPRFAELSAHGLTWIHLDAPTADEAEALARALRLAPARRRGRPLEAPAAEGRRLRRRATSSSSSTSRSTTRSIQRLNAAELDFFLGPNYLSRCRTSSCCRSRGSSAAARRTRSCATSSSRRAPGACSTRCSTTSSTTASRSSTRSATSSTRSRTTCSRATSEEVVRDISNVKQEIISLPQDHQAGALDAAAARARTSSGSCPEDLELYFDDLVDAAERIWDLLDNYKEVVEALGVDERVGDLAPPERHPADPHRLQRRPAAADADHRHLRDERPLPRLRHPLRRSG